MIKTAMARFMQWPLMQPVMQLGIRVLVPKRRVGVALVAMNTQQQVFMLRHVFHPIAPWGLPGGWMDRRESPETCITREVAEETGLTVELGPVVHVAHEPQNAHLTIIYLGHLRPGALSLSAEIMEAAWFDPQELPSPIYNSTQQAIEKALDLYPRWMAEQELV